LRSCRRVTGANQNDIDAAHRELAVHSQRVQIGWEVEEGEPRTDAGERAIALDPETLRVLHAHQAVRDAEKTLHGDVWVDQTGLLFTEPDGTPLAPGQGHDTFTTLAAEAGLPPIRLHDLCHGVATLALAAGVDIKWSRDMLGHFSHAITYTSVLPQVAHQPRLPGTASGPQSPWIELALFLALSILLTWFGSDESATSPDPRMGESFVHPGGLRESTS
jgi:integrase